MRNKLTKEALRALTKLLRSLDPNPWPILVLVRCSSTSEVLASTFAASPAASKYLKEKSVVIKKS